MSAYYNEIDGFAVAWLRALMKARVIPDGEIDTRSIVDVRPADLVGFRHCHFFAGIGGWAYALRLAGWPADREVWTGSCPCQPWSMAGKGDGADDPRHLWPAWFPLIRERRPAVVFGEQTASTDGKYWLDLVLAQMEGIDYAIGAVDLPAACVGAPHGRPRFYLVADADADGCEALAATRVHAHGQSENDALRRGALDVADTTSRGQRADRRASRHAGHADERSAPLDVDDALQQRQSPRRCADGADERVEPAATGARRRRAVGDAGGARLEGHAGHGDHRHEPGRVDTRASRSTAEAGPDGRVGDATGGDRAGVGRFEGGQGSQAQGSGQEQGRWFGESARAGDERGPTSGFWFPCEWIPCREPDGTIKARAVEPGTFPLAHGIPARVGRLRGYGNAIVPQLAAEK